MKIAPFFYALCFLFFGCESNNDQTNSEENTSSKIKAPSFSFTNQYGETITEKSVEGYYYVASFFFARCPGICPKMNAGMSILQDSFRQERRVRFLSHTVDPINDSIPVLQRYAKRYDANPSQWFFLHGELDSVYAIMGEGGYMLSGSYEDGTPENITHSSRLTLVDPEGHIIGYYEGLEDSEIQRLYTRIKNELRNEKY